MATAFPNACFFTSPTIGLGSISVGTAIPGYQTPQQAGVVTGTTSSYAVREGLNWEVGQCTILSGAPWVITRDLIESSSNAGAPISLAGNAQVMLIQSAGMMALPSSAAPLMNAAGAQPGVSIAYARADHVHPSDTTRAPLNAAATTGVWTGLTAAADTNTSQFATTAFMIGQATAATPLMDGAAAVGTSLRYARGDHVHPTDTSRAPLAAPSFTGAVTIGGTITGAGMTAFMAAPGPVGSTTPSSGAFTTLAASGAVSGAGFTSLFGAPPAIGTTTAAAGAFTTLTASGAVSGSGITNLMASPGPIGSATPSSGAFTTLSASSTVSGAGFTSLFATPPAIGITEPAVPARRQAA